MPFPVKTAQQRAHAQAKTAAARTARRQLLDDIRAGRRDLVEVLAAADTDDIISGTKVAALVRAVPEIRTADAIGILERLSIPADRTVRTLNAHQRCGLLDAVLNSTTGER
ncbi:integration host factor, actinobacterial type [Rhodococcus erythropolis]|uniref:integration host factor, actinobacterial type n=1 Tax=Rhodococcus erythropolis TaxID=1833 RepID=UPI00294A6BE2|nr:integration host factor, actinobacterial type [Rhodococcus erythropolis]MDV6278218.1 integration host factor, actinobacterial type [Rhodococcus erythropolis]